MAARATREEVTRVTGPAVAPILFADGIEVTEDAVWLWVVVPPEPTALEEDSTIEEWTWRNARALAAMCEPGVSYTIRSMWAEFSGDDYVDSWGDVDSQRAPGMDHFIDMGAHRIDLNTDANVFRRRVVMLGIRWPVSGDTESRRAVRKATQLLRSSGGDLKRAYSRVEVLRPDLDRWFDKAMRTRMRPTPAPAGLIAWAYSRELRNAALPVPTDQVVKQSQLAALANGNVDPTQSHDYVVITDNVSSTKRYVTILVPAARTGFPAEDLHLPGGEWIKLQSQLPFVDVVVHGVSHGYNGSTALIDKALKDNRSQERESQVVSGPTPEQILISIDTLGQRREEMTRKLDVETTNHARWVVRADSPQELASRVAQVQQEYGNLLTLIVVPHIQDLLWKELLPGDHVRVPEFGHDQPMRTLAGSWFHAGSPLGDATGPYAGGNSGDSPGPVQIHLARRDKVGKSQGTTVVATGSTRAGKSTAIMLMLLGLLGEGGWALLIDNKSDLSGIVDAARAIFTDPVTREQIRVQVIKAMDPATSGRMDPMRFMTAADQARVHTLNAMMGCLNANDRQRGETAVETAIDHVLTLPQEQWSSPLVIDTLCGAEGEGAGAAVAREIGAILSMRAKIPQARAVLGPADPAAEPLMVDRGLVYLDMSGIELPEHTADPDKWSASERCAMMLQRMVLAYATVASRGVRTLKKLVAITELHVQTRYPEGRGFVEWIARTGAALQTYLLLDTQAAADLAAMEGLIEQIVMAFSFRAKGTKEQNGQAVLLGRPDPGPKLRRALKNLEQGQCVARDRFGRLGVLKWDLLTSELQAMLDTNAGDDIAPDAPTRRHGAPDDGDDAEDGFDPADDEDEDEIADGGEVSG